MTLIELLVGSFLLMLVILAIAGSASFLEAQKRTTVGLNGTLENLAMGTKLVSYGIRMAGFGLGYNGQLLCPKINLSYDGNVVADGSFLPPLSITDGGAGSDEITVAYGDSHTGVSKSSLTVGMPTSTSAINVSSTGNIAVPGLALVVDTSGGQACTIYGVTGITPVGGGYNAQLAHVGGLWNAGAFATPASYAAGSTVIGLTAFNVTTYRINNNNLEAVDVLSNSAVTLVDGIVLLKATYGITNGAGGTTIENWVPATGQWAAPTLADTAKIRAVRLFVVAKSPVLEKKDVATGLCTTTASAPTAWAGGPNVDLTGIADWQCYRYRTADLIVSLKNVVMAGVAG